MRGGKHVHNGCLQVGLAVALRFKRDGHAVLLEWARIAHWQRRCKEVLQHAAGRLKNRSLSMAMEEWQYQTWKAAALRHAAHFVHNHALVAAFNSWKAYHDLCLLERAVAKFTQLSTSRWAALPILTHYYPATLLSVKLTSLLWLYQQAILCTCNVETRSNQALFSTTRAAFVMRRSQPQT